VLEVAERRAAQLVGGAVLVDEPGHLGRMAHEVGRELGGHDGVDRAVERAREIDEPPRGGVCHQLFAG